MSNKRARRMNLCAVARTNTVKNFYLIGLTGNLGSGKSTVRKMLEQLGARGIDADLLAHAALARGTPAWRAVVDEFGADLVTFNGRIDRQKLGARVFADANALEKLEHIIHPVVGSMTKELAKQAQTSIVVIEAVKLVEAGMHQWCDALWVVDCNSQVQVERVMRDRHMSAQAAQNRLNAQGSLDSKLKMASIVIDNSGDTQATRNQVEHAWNSIVAESARDKTEWLLGPAATRVADPKDLPVAVAEPTSTPSKTEAATPSVEEQIDIPEWARAPFIELPPAPTKPIVVEPSAPLKPVVDEAPALPKLVAVEPPVIEPVVPVSAPPIEKQEPVVAPPPTWAQEDLVIEVRRARRSDLDAFAEAIAKFESRSQSLSREEAIKRMSERGYRIAVGNKRIVAFAAWEAENLVAIVREVWAEAADIAPKALPDLFKLIEQEAKGLACEAAVLLIPEEAMTLSAEAHAVGYQVSDVANLHKMWRSVVQERIHPGEQIWLKRLREDMIMRPI
jgi:dephospho-CoA kinase